MPRATETPSQTATVIVPALARDSEPISAFLGRVYVDTYGVYGVGPEHFESEGASRQLLSRLAAKLQDPSTTIFLAVQATEVVGIVDFTLVPGANIAEINQLYVAHGRHNQGIGSALWAAMESTLADRGVRVTYLHVATMSAEARKFYAARHFRETWRETWTKHTWTLATPVIDYIKMVRVRP